MASRVSGLIPLAAALALSACATPHIQPPLTPPPGFVGPHVEDQALVMSDGASLPLLQWGPKDRAPWAVIVALHGMNDHGASFAWPGRGGPSRGSRPGPSISAGSAARRDAGSGPVSSA